MLVIQIKPTKVGSVVMFEVKVNGTLIERYEDKKKAEAYRDKCIDKWQEKKAA